MSMQSIDAVKEYSRSSAERLLEVDDRPEEIVPNSSILIILCTIVTTITIIILMYYVLIISCIV